MSAQAHAVVAQRSFDIRGVIEGFYGPPWSHAERLDFLEFMAQHKFNMFVFSPKDEPILRHLWASEPDQEWVERVQELRAKAESLGIRFAVALSPGLSIRYSSEGHRKLLRNKLTFLQK